MNLTCNYYQFGAPLVVDSSCASRSKSALVVDDDPLMGELVEAILTARGFQVSLAAGGRQALELMADVPRGGFDLLFTDVCMPEMNGFELEKEVRKLQPGIRVIFCSGYAASDLESMHCEVVGWAFVRKPFCLESIDMAMDVIEERELAVA